MKNNSIKITKSDSTHVIFDSLTTRQLELLEQLQTILKCARDKDLTDKQVGFFLKTYCRNNI